MLFVDPNKYFPRKIFVIDLVFRYIYIEEKENVLRFFSCYITSLLANNCYLYAIFVAVNDENFASHL